MNLKLRFVDINKNDVISTSGSLCSHHGHGTTPRLKLIDCYIPVDYYVFYDGNVRYIPESFTAVHLIDVNGIEQSKDATINSYYHPEIIGSELYLFECDDITHNGNITR